MLPSMALVGGEPGEKLLALTVVPGRRARFAPPGFVALARSKSSGMPSPSASWVRFTLRAMVPMTPSWVAVMRRLPLETARTNPSLDTVAICGFEVR